MDRIRLTPFSRREFEKSFDTKCSPIERARRAIVRSLMGYGSAGFNGGRYFSAAAKESGSREHEWSNYKPALHPIVDRIDGVVVENRPAIRVMKENDSKRSLHYVDPPYVFITRKSNNDYKHEMTDEEHEELAEALHRLKGHVIVSGYPSKLYNRLFKNWKTRDKTARAVSNTVRIERLWIKPGRS